MLNELHQLPEGFLTVNADQLLTLLGKPTLIHLEGKIKQPLFICTLLHGNETTGFYALQAVLKKYQQQSLPRSISIFIGNPEAAANQQRRLDRQVDYNRIWPGTHEHYLAEAHLVKQVTDIMRDRQPIASIDIHNNTGRNPHYGCINVLDKSYLALAGLFSHSVVYFITPKGVQSAAFAQFCPSVTLECGQSGEVDGVDHAIRYIETCLQLDSIPSAIPDHINLYHTVARVNIPENYSFGFADDATINLHPEIELFNFRHLETGTAIATIEPESCAYLQAFGEDEREVGRDYFEYNNNEIVLRKPVMPSMLTTDTSIIRQDCLCYLMEQISIPE